MLQRRAIPTSRHRRAGFLTPAIACALLVVLAALALVLDRLWLDAARVELTTCAEAASLGAASRLAADELLLPDGSSKARLLAARDAASQIAAANLVAGEPVQLDTAERRDLRFGRLVVEEATGETLFLETERDPRTVLVEAHRTRRRRNPVALFLQGLTGQPAADVVARAEASIDNHVIGIRPVQGSAAPVLPLSILARDPSGLRHDTWINCIEERQGRDDYAYDPQTGAVLEGSDGLPELTLCSRARVGDHPEPNVQILDFRSHFRTRPLVRQIEAGCDEHDLAEQGGALLAAASSPLQFTAIDQLDATLRDALERQIGIARICLIGMPQTATTSSLTCTVACERLVALRILAVRDGADGVCEITVQPCVVATRAAVLGDDDTHTNPYIYKLHLTQ